jgi:adenylate kinase
MITPPTVTQFESFSDIEEKAVNYDFLMLDMEKKWYIEQNERLREMGMNSP